MTNGNQNQVTIIDVQMPFWSMVVFLIKLAFASIPAAIIVTVIISLVVAVFGAIFGTVAINL